MWLLRGSTTLAVMGFLAIWLWWLMGDAPPPVANQAPAASQVAAVELAGQHRQLPATDAAERTATLRSDASLPEPLSRAQAIDAHGMPVEGAEIRWLDDAGAMLTASFTDDEGLGSCAVRAAYAQASHPDFGASRCRRLGDRVRRLVLVEPLASIGAPPEAAEAAAGSGAVKRRSVSIDEFDTGGLALEADSAARQEVEVDITVVDDGGVAAPMATVYVGGHAQRDRTDTAGVLRVRLEPGEVQLSAISADERLLVPVTALAVAHSTTAARLVGHPTTAVRGTVTDLGPMPNRLDSISLHNKQTPWQRTVIGFAPGEDGAFTVRLPAGEWTCEGGGWLPGHDRVAAGDAPARLIRRSTVVIDVFAADGRPTLRPFVAPAKRPNPGKSLWNLALEAPPDWPWRRLLVSTSAGEEVVVGDDCSPGQLASIPWNAALRDGAAQVRLQPTASLVVVPMHRGRPARALTVEISCPGFSCLEQLGTSGAVFSQVPGGAVTITIRRAKEVLAELQAELRSGSTHRLQPVVAL